MRATMQIKKYQNPQFFGAAIYTSMGKLTLDECAQEQTNSYYMFTLFDI